MHTQFYQHYDVIPAYEWPWKNFKPSEIACKSDGSLLLCYDAMDKLQRLRIAWGKPMVVFSGYRSPEYNAKVGGAERSEHMNGTAFDIRTSPNEQEAFVTAAKATGFTGIGLYDTFTHIDIGPKRSWDSRTKRK